MNEQESIRLLRERLVADILGTREETDLPTVDASAAMLNADGLWPDIDYSPKNRASWKAADHLRRLRTMARAVRQADSSGAVPAALVAACNLALHGWLRLAPRSDNWWWNEMFVPQALLHIALLLGDRFDPTLRPTLREHEAAAWSGYGRGWEFTGQNLIWRAEVRVWQGAWEDDAPTIAEAVRHIASTMVVTEREGIQPDRSFHQHGPLIYNGGYGKIFLMDGARLAGLLAGTPWALAPAEIQMLTSYALDGMAWSLHGPSFDPGMFGRNFGRPRADATGDLAKAARQLAEVNAPHAAELRALATHVADREPVKTAFLRGVRHFWRSDYIVLKQDNLYAGVRANSCRTATTECGNGEGRRNFYIGKGHCFFMRTGGEYADIYPLWDWNRVPGVTCPLSIQQPAADDGWVIFGQTPFAGGLSDGTFGLATMAQQDPVRARKSWFFFPGGVAALGAGIASDAVDHVITSVNQAWQTSGVDIVGEGDRVETLVRGERRFSGSRHFRHGGILYDFLGENSPVVVRCAEQTGRWRDLNLAAPDETVRGDVFSLWIDHGVRPRDGTYAYTVQADSLNSDTGENAAAATVVILSNTPVLHAVAHPGGGVTAAVFFEPGRLALPDGTVFTAPVPCALLVRRREGSTWEVSLSNPFGAQAYLRLHTNVVLRGEGAQQAADGHGTEIGFELPGGAEAGRTIRKILQSG